MSSPSQGDARSQLTPLLIATRNPGKLIELRALFASAGYDVLDLASAGVPPSPDEEEVESFDTFEKNALAKARYYHQASGGLPTVADDSGLAVDTLGGAPGVRSRRWALGDVSKWDETAANNKKLLKELGRAADRQARFVCAAAYVDGRECFLERGETLGRIALSPRGTRGFGYDSLFESAELNWRTFGEVEAEEKASVSHRTRAFMHLVHRLKGDAHA